MIKISKDKKINKEFSAISLLLLKKKNGIKV